jgi:hypothetical protein
MRKGEAAMKVTASGIFWVDGILKIGQQIRLAIAGGFAQMTIPLTWRFSKNKAAGVPATWPTQQQTLDFNSKARLTLRKRIRIILNNVSDQMTASGL